MPDFKELDHIIEAQSIGKMYKLYTKPMDKIVDALNLNKLMPWRKSKWQEFWALRDINLTVKRGERLGIVGRNGAGKSTFLKIIAGNIEASEGSISVNGRVQALMELGTGFHPEFTGRENIRASLTYQGLSKKNILEKEQEIIDFSELDEFIDQPVRTYSAGMYARLAFTTATSIEPSILIIDEILGAGDAYFAAKSLDRMRKLTENFGTTVLFVSHDLASVQHICTRAIWIDRGQIIEDGNPLAITKSYYASIRRQEEKRLQKRNSRYDVTQKDGTWQIAGRFVTSEHSIPQFKHHIRNINILVNENVEVEIRPGKPMDNDVSIAGYLLTDREKFAWSAPIMISNERVRSFERGDDDVFQAPFVFNLPVSSRLKNLKLVVEHLVDCNEIVQIELYKDDSYHTIGNLECEQNTWHTQSWDLSEIFSLDTKDHNMESNVSNLIDEMIITTEQLNSEEVKPSLDDVSENDEIQLTRNGNDKYSSNYASILAMRLLNRDGNSQIMYSLEDTVNIEVDIQIKKEISKSDFVISIYSLSGVVIANLYWNVDRVLKVGVYRWQVSLVKPNLRQAEYIISSALIKEMNFTTNEEIKAFALWDRAISLRVEEDYIGNMPLGLVYLQTQPEIGDSLSPNITEILVD